MRRRLRTLIDHAGGEAPRPQAREVLVVDDSRAQRHVLALALARGGYAVTQAGSGEEALALCRSRNFDMVISDWMMPGMSGLDFVRAFRDLPRTSYGYVILLTSKSEKTEVASGLDCGADDFLSKPVNPDELRARLRAGERILGMEAELTRRSQVIGAALEELQKLYGALDQDLIEARRLLDVMVADRQRQYDWGEVSVLLRPSGHVGGDIAGAFPIDDRRIALYSVDVAGHGVASAMMTARLAGLFADNAVDFNAVLRQGPAGRDAWPPEEVAARLNRFMSEALRVDQYFTLAYAELDTATGAVSLVQAGHPHPVVLRADGGVEQLGNGGLPVGLLDDVRWSPVATVLAPGDRLFLVSDGVTEAPDPQGRLFGDEGLATFLTDHCRMSNAALLEALVWSLAAHAQTEDFPDDVSGLLVHYRPAGG